MFYAMDENNSYFYILLLWLAPDYDFKIILSYFHHFYHLYHHYGSDTEPHLELSKSKFFDVV